MKNLLIILLSFSFLGTRNNHLNKPADIRQDSEKSIISELEEGDIMTIDHTSTGCFHYREEKIIISCKSEDLSAELFVEGEFKKRVKLNPESKEKMLEFEKRALQMKNKIGGCTTSELYLISLNDSLVLSLNDTSCRRWGFKKLKENLFKIES